MRSILFATVLALMAGCSTDVTSHVSALSGERCEPDASYMPKAKTTANTSGNGNECQGTGPGDNCDDLHSGKIDCIGDGNSGQGDDKKHNCEFPQPGCDENGCCDEDMVDPPVEPPVEPPAPPTEPEPQPEPDPVPVL